MGSSYNGIQWKSAMESSYNGIQYGRVQWRVVTMEYNMEECNGEQKSIMNDRVQWKSAVESSYNGIQWKSIME